MPTRGRGGGVRPDGLPARGDYRMVADPSWAEIRKVLKSQDKTLPRQFNKIAKGALDPIVQSARRHAGVFSTRIPRTVRGGADRRGPYVRAGGPRAPHAGVWEGTAAGADRKHPVFGGWPKRTGSGPARHAGRDQWIWVVQRRRPYLARAGQEQGETVAGEIGAALAAQLRDQIPTS